MQAISPTSIQLASTYREQYFTPRYKPTYRLSDYQHYLAKRLFQELHKVMFVYAGNTFFKDLGIVLPDELKAYDREGRRLPELTDLYYGVPAPVRSKEYQRYFGTQFTHSVGGMQFVTRGKTEPWALFRRIVWEARQRNWLFGSVHFVTGSLYKEPIIYVTNDKIVTYNMHVRDRLVAIEGRRFWASTNNGITLKPYIPVRP